MRKKLVLVNPVNKRRRGLTVNPSSRFPPLCLGIVAALTPDNWDVEIVDENFDHFKFKEADLVGFTAFTSSITRAYEISAIYRKKGVKTVIGGIHASMMPDEASRYCDSVVVGEAEATWAKLIDDFENGKIKKRYEGDFTNVTELTGARHDLFHPGYLFDSVQTARGCPMDCDFCSVTVFNGRRYRQRSVEDVLDELETIKKKTLYIVDDNIYGYGKQAAGRAISLFKGIIDRGIKIDWLCQASINFAENDEVLEYAAKSGCRLVLLGIEAENSDALKDANKKLNMKTLKNYKDIFRRINSHGIGVLGSFIYGMDSDTPKTLNDRTDYILNSSVDAIQISVMTPLPGTRLFSRMNDEGRLLYTNFPEDWDQYDMTNVVFKPGKMEQSDLSNSFFNAGYRLYNPLILWNRYLRSLANTGDITTSWWAYSANSNYMNSGLYGIAKGLVPW